MMDYLDFELRIAPGSGGAYPVSVIRSPAGESGGTMHFPYDSLTLENQLQSIQIALLKAGSVRRDVTSDDDESVSRFGRELFEALMVAPVRETFHRGRDRARAAGKGLRVRLRIEAPELATLPWEFLYDPSEGDYVCLSSDTPVVRYLELDRPPEPVTVRPPLSILGMIASPSDHPPLDVEREKTRVEEATAVLRAAGLFTLTWLEGSTWRDLQKAMRRGPFHLFHFVGHGGFDRTSGEGEVALTDESGRAQRIKAHELGRLLADHQSLRLVVLNSCLGAKGSTTQLFSSTASVLVRRGLPAVIAMQYEISDRAAIEFARSLYEALADEMPVDGAVAEARKAMSLSVSNSVEWGTPVLYMRSPDGALFHIDGMTTSVARASGRLSRPVEAVTPPAAIEPVDQRLGSPARVADRWDALAFTTIIGLGALAWATWGRPILDASETWLWGAALLLPMLLWWFGRRALQLAGSDRPRSVARYVVRRAAVVLLAGGLWGVTAWRQYRVPTMSRADGILVARFPGDPQNALQDQWVELLRSEARRNVPLVPLLAIARLPRRPADPESARRYGTASGAAAVFWGSASSPATVEFIQRPGVLQAARAEVGGGAPVGAPERLSFAPDTTAVRLLTGLLQGFASYRSAVDSAALRRTGDILSTALQDSSSATPDESVKSMLAMLHFLRGNTWLRRGVPDSAQADYRAAIEESAIMLPTARPTYVEALNNLALIEGRRGRYDSAWALLQSTKDVCTPAAGAIETPPFVCNYAEFQKGTLRIQQERYAEAESLLHNVVAGPRGRPSVPADDLLIALAHQNLAYAQVRHAGTRPGPDAEALLDQAAGNGAQAVAIANRVVADTADRRSLTDRWAITRARILLARRRWKEARDTLQRIVESMPGESRAHFLEAAAVNCLHPEVPAGESKEAQDLLIQAWSSGDSTGLGDYNRISNSCFSGRR